jgi:Zinc knuckle
MSDYIVEIKKDGVTIANGGVSADGTVRVLIAIMNQKAAEAADVQYVERGHEEATPPVPGPRPLSIRDKQKEKKVERTTTGRKKTACGACGEVGHTSRSPNCPLKAGGAAPAAAREPNHEEGVSSAKIKRLLKEGHDDDFVAGETNSSPRVVAFIRKQMHSRGEL